jgi:hypothetical protein
MAGAAAQTPTVINLVCDGFVKQSHQKEMADGAGLSEPSSSLSFA